MDVLGYSVHALRAERPFLFNCVVALALFAAVSAIAQVYRMARPMPRAAAVPALAAEKKTQ